MPAYNAHLTLESAMLSVLSQTHSALELIVVDDHSSDDTLSIACDIATRDSRVRVIANDENLGVSRSRLKGIKAASSEWIALLDSDDMWLPEKLEKQVVCQSSTSASLVFTGSGFMDERGKVIDWVLHVPSEMDYEGVLKQNLISNSSVLIERELLLKHLVCRDDIHEDFACWLSMLKSGVVAQGVDEPLLIYRLSSTSKSGNKIHSALMNWRTYRLNGLGMFASIRYMISYTFNGIQKYRAIARAESRMG
jgi:teichuronic acid biosynthesis glycosyltransferase TuaG